MNVIKLDLNLVFLERKLLKLQQKEEKMNDSCKLKDWFRIKNEIRAIKNKLQILNM